MVEVRLFGYQNPTGRCEQCPNSFISDPRRCCDDFSRDSYCDEGDRECDSYFTYCLKPYGIGGMGCSNLVESLTSTVNTDDGPLDFSQSTVLGLPNPLQLPINDNILSASQSVSNCYS